MVNKEHRTTEGATTVTRTGQGIQPPLSLSAPVSWLGRRLISVFAVGCLSASIFAAGGYVGMESLGPDEGMREGGDICGGGGLVEVVVVVCGEER